VTEADIREWCIGFLSRTVESPEMAIDAHSNFAAIGLDSASAAYFIVELEEWLGTELEPEIVFEYPTIAELARHVAGRAAGDGQI
jgi:acyl carrier protein